MPTPIDLTGTYHNQDGTAASGRVSFRLSTVLTDSTGDVLVAPVLKTVDLDAAGAFSITLYATNSPDILQEGATYTATEVIDGAEHDGQRHRSFSFELPYDAVGGTVDLADLAPVEDATITYGLRDLPFVVLAPSDAPTSVKRVAQHVCDADDDDDDATWAEAIAEAEGGTLLVAHGTIRQAATYEIPSNTTVAGMGMGKTMIEAGLLPAHDDEATYTTETMIRGVGASHVTVRDLTLQFTAGGGRIGLSFDEGCTDCRAERVEVSGMTKPGLRVAVSGSRITFSDCYVHDAGASGGAGIIIDAFSAGTITDVQIIGNTVERATPESTQAAILAWAFSATIARVLIADNVVNDASGSNGMGISCYAAGTGSVDRVIMSNNVVDGNAADGIRLRTNGGSSVVRDCIITNNMIQDSGAWGIHIAGGSSSVGVVNPLIANNTVRNNTSGQLNIGSSPISGYLVRSNLGIDDNPALAALSTLALEAVVVTGELAVGNNVLKPGARIPRASTLTEVYARVGTAPVGAAITVGVNRNGTEITTVTIADGATSGSTTGLALTLTAGQVITFDVDSVGSSTAGSDLAVALIGA